MRQHGHLPLPIAIASISKWLGVAARSKLKYAWPKPRSDSARRRTLMKLRLGRKAGDKIMAANLKLGRGEAANRISSRANIKRADFRGLRRQRR